MTDVALIFPGQGAQTVGMGQAFYKASFESKTIFDQADTVIDGLSDVIFNGTQEKLTETAFCQPAIFTFSVAALEAFKASDKFSKYNVKFVAGLSLGELSAVTASGALSFEDTLKVVERRSSFMDVATKKKPGAMCAIIGFDCDKISEICRQTGAEVANFNSPLQTVITGDKDKVKLAADKISEAGAKRVIPLDVSGAFHSSLMASAVPEFSEALTGFNFDEASVAVVSNVDGKPQTSGEAIKSNLTKQITSSVQWVNSIEYMKSQGVETFIEIGPGSVLKGLVKKIDRGLKVFNIAVPEDIDKL
jgi:[acyl-carrier-protein] S-malonyltransferase